MTSQTARWSAAGIGALGWAAGAALLSLASLCLWQPLRYPDPESLWALGGTTDVPNTDTASFWGQAPSLASTGYWQSGAVEWENQRLAVTSVSSRFFETLGLRFAAGGPPADFADPWAVVSDTFAKERGVAPKDLIGQPIRLPSGTLTIAGVLAPRQEFPERTRLFVRREPGVWHQRFEKGEWFGDDFGMVARAKPGATKARLEAELMTLLNERKRDAGRRAGMGDIITATPLRVHLSAPARTPALVALAVGLILWAAATLNVIGLLWGDGLRRSLDWEIRRSLGAPESRLAWESLQSIAIPILSAFLAASLLAGAALAYLREQRIWLLPRQSEVELSAPVVFGIGLLAGFVLLLAALTPTFAQQGRWSFRGVSRSVGVQLLGKSGTAVGGLTWRFQAWQMILLLQVAVLCFLVAFAWVTTRSLLAMQAVNLGFETEGRRVIAVRLPEDRSPAALVERLSTTGSRWCAMSQAPIAATRSGRLSVRGPSAYVILPVTTYYGPCDAVLSRNPMGESAWEQAGNGSVAVVNRNAAQRLGLTPPFIGSQLQVEQRTESARSVVAVAPVWSYFDGAKLHSEPEVFRPFAEPKREPPDRRGDGQNAEIRPSETNRVPWYLVGYDPNAREDQIAARAGGETLAWIRRLESVTAEAHRREQLMSRAAVLIGLLSAVLTAAGCASVAGFAFFARRREFAIRSALGAAPHTLRGMILSNSVQFGIPGIAAGLVAFFWFSKLLASLVYGVRPADAWTLAGASAVVMLLLILASLPAAWRAGRTDPARTLRAL